MTKTKRYHHGDLRAELIRTAITKIATDGVAAMTLRGLAKDLGVSHAAPARHFVSRTELLATIARDGLAGMVDESINNSKHEANGVARLRAVAKGYMNWVRANPAYYQVLRLPDLMSHRDEAAADLLRKFAKYQTENVQAAQREGWRSNEDTQLLFMQIVAFIVGLAVMGTDSSYATAFPEIDIFDRADATIDQFFS